MVVDNLLDLGQAALQGYKLTYPGEILPQALEWIVLLPLAGPVCRCLLGSSREL